MTWAPAYLTTSQLASYMRITDTDDDTELSTAIEAASRAIDDYCNRQFGKVAAAEARSYTAQWNYERRRWTVAIDDLQTTTNLVISIGAVAVTDYKLEPRNAVLEGKAWTRLVLGPNAEATPSSDGEYEVLGTGIWGWTSFPNAVVEGCKIQGSRFHSRRDSPYGIAGSPDAGSELRLLAKLDPDVAVSLRGYRRPRRVG